MALTTLSNIKAMLNVTTTSQDAWLAALQAGAERNIKNYCKRDLEEATNTEYYSGSGQKVLVLRQTPVQSITSIYLDHYGNFGYSAGAFPASTLLTAGIDYELGLDGSDGSTPVSLSGIVYRTNTVWPEVGRFYTPGKLTSTDGPNFGNVKVTYVSGYHVIPDDLQYAVTLLVSQMKNTVKFGGIPLESERIGDYSYRLHYPVRPNEFTRPEMSELYSILDSYRDQSMGWA